MKLQKAKKLQSIFKPNENEVSRRRFTSKEQKSALENITLLYELREAVSKLFND